MLSLEAKLIAGALALASLLGGLLWFVHSERAVGALQCKAAVAAAQALEHQKTVAESVRNDQLAAQLAQSQASRKVVYAQITRTVDRFVDRPVYRTACVDSDGLRGINDALAGKASDPGIAASAVSDASAP